MEPVWQIVIQILNWAGIPVVIGWALYDRRKLKTENDVAEATSGDKVKTSSIITLEAELVAARKSFDADRQIKDNTIIWLERQLVEAREEDARKEAVIERLLAQARDVNVQLDNIRRENQRMQRELEELQNNRPLPHPRPKASDKRDDPQGP